MFLEIYTFELKNRFKRPAPYVFFFIFALVAFAYGSLFGGAFGDVTASNSKTVVNSPMMIATILGQYSSDLIGIIVLTAIMAPAIYNDFRYNVHSILFTKPLTKASYFFGRFAAAFTYALIVMSALYLGYVLAEFNPYCNPDRFGPINVVGYIQSFLFFVVPNTLLIGGIIFGVVTLTRNMLYGYVTAIVIMVVNGLASVLTQDIENIALAGMVDPTGAKALGAVTRYWTVVERNENGLTLSGVLLWNRIMWLAVGLAVFTFTYVKFEFSQLAGGLTSKSGKSDNIFRRMLMLDPASSKRELGSGNGVIKASSVGTINLPKVSTDFSNRSYLNSFFPQIWTEIKLLLGNVAFIVIGVIGLLVLFLSGTQIGKIFGTTTFPVTYSVLEQGIGVMGLFILIITIFFAGVLVWRERDAKVNELLDATPVPNWFMMLSKYFALVAVQAVLLSMVLFSGIIIQIVSGYFEFELGHYLFELFVVELSSLMIVGAFAMFIQSLVNNRYMGYFLVILLLNIVPGLLGMMEFNHSLYHFNSSGPSITYSDLNGYGHFLSSYFAHKTYWTAFSVFMLMLALLFWARGKNTDWKSKFKVAKYNFKGGAKWGTFVSLAVFVGAGGFIFYNTNILNEYNNQDAQLDLMESYERDFKQYEKNAQPRIVESNVNVAIYPEERDVDLKGFYWLKNKSAEAIAELYINVYAGVEINELMPEGGELKESYEDHGFYIFTLGKTLQPGDSVKFNYDMSVKNDGFSASGGSLTIVENGTFFNSGYLPAIGYSDQGEIYNPAERKKRELAEKPRMADIHDESARANTYISNDADRIRFEAIVSTSPDQIGMAPGYLLKEWEEDGRKYYHYKMDDPILDFYCFLSARYTVTKDVWVNEKGEDVSIEVYHYPSHEYNVAGMINATKKSLEYYSKNFSPYQYRQLRILEFPRYQTFAQSFANTVPFSEGIGFIADVDTTNENVIDYPFYVTSHEVAHQWWAHQVLGANCQGASVMSETMSQYSALMVMKQEYGEEKMQKFLKQEMDSYLRGRTREDRKEVPLMLCENQQYIHYNKGSVVMYALQDYIGEDAVNLAMQRYIKKVGFQSAPYTTSLEFMAEIEAVTPDSLCYMIEDMFETITLYDNKIDTLYYDTLPNNQYEVTVKLDCKKLRADDFGNEEEVKLNDWMDVVVYQRKKVGKYKKETVPLFEERMRITEGAELKIIVDTIPHSVGIDPNYLLIDRKPTDNIRKFGSSKGSDSPFGGEVQLEL